MAEIAAISSVVGIIGLAGQITQGCYYLKNLIGDIRDAPKELTNLRDELDIIEGVVNSSAAALGAGNEALRACLEAISCLKDEVGPALLAFSKSNGLERNCGKVKAAVKKQRTKECLERLSRAKDTLVAAQMNVSLWVCLALT